MYATQVQRIKNQNRIIVIVIVLYNFLFLIYILYAIINIQLTN